MRSKGGPLGGELGEAAREGGVGLRHLTRAHNNNNNNNDNNSHTTTTTTNNNTTTTNNNHINNDNVNDDNSVRHCQSSRDGAHDSRSAADASTRWSTTTRIADTKQRPLGQRYRGKGVLEPTQGS